VHASNITATIGNQMQQNSLQHSTDVAAANEFTTKTACNLLHGQQGDCKPLETDVDSLTPHQAESRAPPRNLAQPFCRPLEVPCGEGDLQAQVLREEGQLVGGQVDELLRGRAAAVARPRLDA
jgi:hypothetical protein